MISPYVFPGIKLEITQQRINSIVAYCFGMTEKEMWKETRLMSVCTARQVAQYFGYEYKDKMYLSLVNIGWLTGRKAFSSVIHSHKKISERIKNESDLREKVRMIQDSIGCTNTLDKIKISLPKSDVCKIQDKFQVFDEEFKRILSTSKSDYSKMTDIIELTKEHPDKYALTIFSTIHSCYSTLFEYLNKSDITYDDYYFYIEDNVPKRN